MWSGSGRNSSTHSRPKPLDDRKPGNDRIFDVSSVRPALLLCPDAPELTKWSTNFTLETLQDTREAVFWRTIRTSLLVLPSVPRCCLQRSACQRRKRRLAVAAHLRSVRGLARHLLVQELGPPSSSSDLPAGGAVGAAINAVPIEGLYDRKRGAVSDTVKRNPPGLIDRQDTGKSGNTKDQLGKGLPGPQPPRPSRVPPAGEQRFVATEVLVALPSNFTPQTLDTLARRHRLVRLEAQAIGLTGTTFHRWQITDQRSVADVVRALEVDTGVRAAQPNYRFTLQQAQGSAAGDYQYALAKLRLPEAHRLATGGSVLVAVIDNGIDTAHPELADVIADSFDATGRPEPPAHHGTGMAGTIAAHALSHRRGAGGAHSGDPRLLRRPARPTRARRSPFSRASIGRSRTAPASSI